MRSEIFGKIFLSVLFGIGLFLFSAIFVPKGNEAYATMQYVTAFFGNRTSVPLIISYTFYYSYNGIADACPTGTVLDDPVSASCLKIDGTRYAHQFDPMPPGELLSIDAVYPDDASKPPPYYLWWNAAYLDGSWCNDPSVQFEGHNVFWRADIEVTCTAPPDPGPPTPANFVGSCSSTTGTNTWSASTGAASYVVISGTTNPPENGSYSTQTPTGTSVNWSGLSPGTTYYQRINAVGSGGAWSSPAYTSITCVTAPTPPPEPTRNTPIQTCGSTNVNVTFSWGTVSGATYRLDIWDPNGVWSGNSHEGGGSSGWAYQDTGSSTSWTWNNFPSNSGQTWTARAYKGGLWSNMATWSGFTTIDCSTVAAPTNLAAGGSCPFSALVVDFSWQNNATNATVNYLQVSTSSIFSSFATKNLTASDNSFTWSSASQMTSGSPLSPAYGTQYYTRIRAYNSNTGIYSTYSPTYPFTTPPSSSCTNPVVNITLFNDKDGDGIMDAGEGFGAGGNPAFSSSFTTLQEYFGGTTTNITSNVQADGTVLPVRTLAAGQLGQYIVTGGTNWVLTKYNSDKSLSAPACTAGSSCSYAPGGYTGNWLTAVNSVWNLNLGVQATTATLNATVFYDKDGDGIKDAGEDFNLGGNSAFNSSIATIWEGSNGNSPNPTDKTSSFSAGGGYSRSVLAAQSTYWYQFRVTPAVGWAITKYQSNMSLTTGSLPACATANSPCNYGSVNSVPGYTGWKYPAPSNNVSFLLGVAPMAPANPNAGSSSSFCTGAPSVSLSWTDNATFETEYELDISANSAFSPIVGTRPLGANTTSFIWSSTNKLANAASPAYGTTYYWRVRAINLSVASSNVYPTANGVGTTNAPGVSVATPTLASCTPPTNPVPVSVTSACSAGNVRVTFQWTVSTNATGYWLDVNSAKWTGESTPSPWGYKQITSGATSTWIWSVSSSLSGGPPSMPINGNTYYWRLQAYNANFSSSHMYYNGNGNGGSTTPSASVSFTTPNCAAPSNPSNLTAVITCLGGVPTAIRFNWQDNASNESDYIVDVNLNAWTGDGTPSPWGYKSSLGANATTFNWTSASPLSNGPPTVPANNTTYYWRVVAYSSTAGLYSGHVYPNSGVGTTAPPGTAVTADCQPNLSIVPGSFSIAAVDSGQTATANLTVRNVGGGDTSAGFKVALNKNSSTMNCTTTEDGFVNTTALTAGATRALTITFTAPTSMGSYTAVAMADADCAITESNETDNTLTTTYTVRGFDLTFSFKSDAYATGALDNTVYDQSTTANGVLTVTNNSVSTISSPATGVTIGFWPDGSVATPVFPNCPGQGQPSPPYSFPTSGSIGALAPGASTDVSFSFITPNLARNYVAKAYIIPNCSPVDADWTNNSGQIQVTVAYAVVVKTWFRTQGGDVGSRGSIGVSRPNKTISNYIAVGTSFSNSPSADWMLNGYTAPLFPTGNQPAGPTTGRVYDYFKERYLADAKKQGGKSTLASLALTNNGLNYYFSSSEVAINGSTLPVDGSYVWFIDGNAKITNNISLVSRPNLALVVIVSGNLTIANGAVIADGVYVTGGTLKTTDNDSTTQSQLVVHGAFYGRDLQLKRVLATGNDVNPAEDFIFEPKYLVLFNTILGSPNVGWQEQAP